MALNFIAASNQRVLIRSLSNLRNVTGASISAWVNITSVGATERHLCAYSIGTSTSSARLAITLFNSPLTFRTSARRLDADAVTSLNSSVTYGVGVLAHVIAVARYNTGALEIYVDGVLSGSVAIAGWTGATSDTNSQAASIGGRSDGNSVGAYDGILDDVRVYNRALTSVEVSNIYYARGKDSVVYGLVNRFKMMELPVGGSGAAVIDSIGGLPGSLVSLPSYAQSLVSPRRRRK